jgi:hypothetical protein
LPYPDYRTKISHVANSLAILTILLNECKRKKKQAEKIKHLAPLGAYFQRGYPLPPVETGGYRDCTPSEWGWHFQFVPFSSCIPSAKSLKSLGSW